MDDDEYDPWEDHECGMYWTGECTCEHDFWDHGWEGCGEPDCTCLAGIDGC